MPQVLKDEVRTAIARAALEAFAREGFAGARMPEIAAAAGISTGNVYRYFKSKDDLFYAVVDVRFAAAFLRVMRRRVRTLRISPDLASLDAEAQQAADELLAFWIAHRLEVVVILSRAQGSRYEGFSGRIVRELTRLALAEAAASGRPPDPDRAFVLGRVFENTLSAIVAILLSTADGDQIRRRIAHFWRYQLAGLGALARA